MFNSVHSLFDSLDVSKTSHFKITFMKNSMKSIAVFFLFTVFILKTDILCAQKNYTIESKDSNARITDKKSVHSIYAEKYMENSLILIPITFGFDNKHKFSSRWPEILDKNEKELEGLFNLCQVNCAERFKALLKRYDFNDLTISNVVARYESHQFLKAQCQGLWDVLSQIQKKANTKDLIAEINKKCTIEDSQLAEKVLKMTKNEFLHMAFRDSRGTTSIVKKIDKLNQSL